MYIIRSIIGSFHHKQLSACSCSVAPYQTEWKVDCFHLFADWWSTCSVSTEIGFSTSMRASQIINYIKENEVNFLLLLLLVKNSSAVVFLWIDLIARLRSIVASSFWKLAAVETRLSWKKQLPRTRVHLEPWVHHAVFERSKQTQIYAVYTCISKVVNEVKSCIFRLICSLRIGIEANEGLN